VANTRNPSYSGGKDQEDHGLKTARANCSQNPILEKTQRKKSAGGVALSSNLSTKGKKKKKTRKQNM
jgi:hypothetical protein